MNISFRAEGLKEAIAKLGKARGEAQHKFTAVMYQWAEATMTEAKLLTPVDTGALRASGQVQDQSRGTQIKIVLGFGNSAIGYAVYVHENLQAHHPVGQAKFLETPFNARLPKLRQDLSDAVAELLRRK